MPLGGATILVAPDGTWTFPKNIPVEAVAGPITFLANCAGANSPSGSAPIFWYSQVGSFMVSGGTTTTEAPVTTTTESPTTTADPGTTTTTTAPGSTTTAAPAAKAAAVRATPSFTG